MKNVFLALGLVSLVATPAFANKHAAAAKKAGKSCYTCKDAAPADGAAVDPAAECKDKEWVDAADKAACEAQGAKWHEAAAAAHGAKKADKKAPAKK